MEGREGGCCWRWKAGREAAVGGGRQGGRLLSEVKGRDLPERTGPPSGPVLSGPVRGGLAIEAAIERLNRGPPSAILSFSTLPHLNREGD